MGPDTRTMRNVALFGAGGGLMTWFFLLWDSPERELAWYMPPTSVLLGAGAGLVFVFLIANTDRNDTPRVLTLALLAGFSWEPVLQAGRALVNQRGDERRAVEATAVLDQAFELVGQFEAADASRRSELLGEIEKETSRAIVIVSGVDSFEQRARLGMATNAIVQSLASLVDTDDIPGSEEVFRTTERLDEVMRNKLFAPNFRHWAPIDWDDAMAEADVP